MASSIDFTRGEVVHSADTRVTLYGVSWLQYETMLAWRGESPIPRYSYLDGVLEIMSPSFDHERIKSYIGRIVEAYALAVGIEFTPVGSWTLKHALSARGAEPDECYIIGEHVKERPDLVIEVIWTSGGIDKLEIYRGLGVREVWLVKNGAIAVHELVDGTYSERPRSVAFPGLDLALVVELVGEPTASAAQRKIAAWAVGVTSPLT
ncbi:MAG: Uma2 family endonuclease [Clostridia bacterium]|nr:Uma2 family endonuclease [Deltaproteobacteria bacterium]